MATRRKSRAYKHKSGYHLTKPRKKAVLRHARKKPKAYKHKSGYHLAKPRKKAAPYKHKRGYHLSKPRKKAVLTHPRKKAKPYKHKSGYHLAHPRKAAVRKAAAAQHRRRTAGRHSVAADRLRKLHVAKHHAHMKLHTAKHTHGQRHLHIQKTRVAAVRTHRADVRAKRRKG